MSKRDGINQLIENIDRKLLLIEGEKKSSRRKEIIDSLMYGEMAELRKELNFVFSNP